MLQDGAIKTRVSTTNSIMLAIKLSNQLFVEKSRGTRCNLIAI